MSASGSWQIAARHAWREGRGGPGALWLLFTCLLLGVFAMAGVGSLGMSIASSIAAQGQQILGGDIEIRLSQREPYPDERAAIQSVADEISEIIRTRAMVRGETGAAAGRQLLGELKAVDGNWPLYGQADLATGGGNAAVQQALRQGVVIGQALAEQLGLQTGDMVSIGEASLPVSAVLSVEPDRASQGFTLGPTVLLALDRLPETGLIQPGSLYQQHIRVKLPAEADPEATIEQLKQRFPEAGWRLSSFTDAAPGVQRFVGQLGQFLMLVSLASLAIAGVGVGNGVQSYLDGKAETIATLKALGAPTAMIRRIYLLLVGAVALAGAAAGALLGAVIPYVAIAFAGHLLPVEVAPGIYPLPLLMAILFGLLIALAFAAAPLARASALPVQRVIRGMVEPWPWPSRAALLTATGAGILVLIMVLLQARDRMLALWFLCAVAAALLVLLGLGTLLRRLADRLPRPRRLLPRLALGNIARQGATTRQLVVALGLGLSLFACLAFVESGFNAELRKTVPEKAPAFFLLDLPKEEHDRFLGTLPQGSDTRLVPSLRGPVVAVNGVSVSEIRDMPDGSYVLRGDRGLTFSADIPEGNRIVAGSWWPADYAGPPLVSMDAEQAGYLGLKVGDTITVSVMGVDITATIASLREIDWDSLGFNFVLVYDPHTLAGAPYSYMATVTPPTAAIAGFTSAISNAFPTVSVIRVQDVLTQVEQILRQTGVAVRAAASGAILAGIAVLVGALAAQVRARTMENVILKALGATRRQLMAAAFLEHAAIALVLAAVSLLLGALAGWVVVTLVMKFGWQPNWWLALATVGTGAVVTMLLGLVGAWRTLGASVASALRES